MEQGKKRTIEVKSKMFFRIWLFLGSFGMGAASLWVFYMGITFQTKFYLLAIPLGLLCSLFFFVLFLSAFPAFTKRGNVIFRIEEEDCGRLFTEKKSVDIKDIKSIRMDRHPYSPKGIFFMDVLIQTRGNGLVRIPTYNILPEPEFYKAVELHVLSYMTEEARQDWIGQFTEAQRKAYLNQFHKNA
ncbi:YfjD family protein [Bacillus glycinifermentans]|uniref:YfjD family protein n=2 Tax=Bacillus glycinifermentans TaxID=1664069 RepID=UPI002DBEF1B5|nr:YfjD family protein [Bacillus glycinifermentans]MEC3608159.1 YfjD family protein [Bacillus glycinifermentans]